HDRGAGCVPAEALPKFTRTKEKLALEHRTLCYRTAGCANQAGVFIHNDLNGRCFQQGTHASPAGSNARSKKALRKAPSLSLATILGAMPPLTYTPPEARIF